MIEPSSRTRELLTVLQWPRIGPVKALDVLRRTPATESIIEHARRAYPEAARSDRGQAALKVQRIIEDCRDLSVQIIGFDDSDFPTLLRGIPKAPPILYVRGAASVLSRDGVAVVGTRRVSATGSRIAGIIGAFVAQHGFNVVSGLALGVDMRAHEAALKAYGTTTAVLAHGLHMISPPSHGQLAESIVAEGGALVSEHAPGVPPRRAEFVRRNRIQSGLSLASIVVESGIKGGSIHQARFTRDQGRVLVTVLAASSQTRGDLDESGARYLVSRLGATPVHGTSELHDVLIKLQHIEGLGGAAQPDLEW